MGKTIQQFLLLTLNKSHFPRKFSSKSVFLIGHYREHIYGLIGSFCPRGEEENTIVVILKHQKIRHIIKSINPDSRKKLGKSLKKNLINLHSGVLIYRLNLHTGKCYIIACICLL